MTHREHGMTGKHVMSEEDLDKFEAGITVDVIERVLTILENGEPVYLGPHGHWQLHQQRAARIDVLFARFRAMRDVLKAGHLMEGP